MKIYLSEDCYKWLVELKIIKAYIVPQESVSHVVEQQATDSNENLRRYELCYDDQIYLENGYLVGVLMRDILKAHHLYSDKLLKIRKIALLKKSENWAIIYEVLQFLDFPFSVEQQQHKDLSPPELKQIERMLEFLYNDYGPFAQNRRHKDHRYYHIEPSLIHPQYQKNRKNQHLDGVSPYSYPHCNNLLEYTCFVVHKCFDFQLKIQECMGLLVDRGKYLKKIIIQGLPKLNQSDLDHSQSSSHFQKAEILYQEILNSMSSFDQLLIYEPDHLEHFMDIFATGVLSRSQHIAQLAALLIQTIQNQQWFKTHGIKIMIQSEWPEVFNLMIDKSKGFFGDVFNSNLETMFVYEEDFLAFLIRFLPVLSKSMYSKEVLESLPIAYMIEKSTNTFDPDDIAASESKIRILSRQVLTILFRHFFKKIPQIERSRACIAFDINPYFGLQMSYHETFTLLENLFELIKVFLVNEDSTVEKYFRIALRYLKAKEHDIKEMVVENLKQLYFTLRKSFPLGAFLTAYEEIVALNPIKTSKSPYKSNVSPIAQNFDFEFLVVISKDQSLVEDEVTKTLNIALEYFMQINGDCFLEVILNLLKFKESSEWCGFISEEILSKWTQIKLPPLISNVYNRKSPQELCRFEAFGVKRRQILKFQEYQKYKLLLEAICQLKDGGFLREYGQKVSQKVQQIKRNKELAAYNIFLKKLVQKIRMSRTLLPEPVDLASKSLIYVSERMERSEMIASRLEELNQEDEEKGEAMEENNEELKKLRDKVTESPIQQNRKEAQNIMNQNCDEGENDGTDDEFNQFLQSKLKTSKGLNSQNLPNPNDHESKQLQSSPALTYEFIRPFTSQEFKLETISSPTDIFIYPEEWQQFQLTYIAIQRQNNLALIEVCTQIYLQTFQDSNSQNEAFLLKFLTQIKLSKYLPLNQATILWKKTLQIHCINSENFSQLNPQKARSIVWQLLVQYSFLMFGFKRNTRIRVKLIQIFLKLLASNLPQGGLNKVQSKIKAKPETIMRRQINFEHQLISSKILKWNPQYQNQYLKGELVLPKNPLRNDELREQIASQVLQSHQISANANQAKLLSIENQEKPKYELKQICHNSLEPWLLCFQLLNDIIGIPIKQKSLGLGLIEPISKITTSVLPQSKAGEKKLQNNAVQMDNVSNSEKEALVNDQQLELMLLEEELEKMQSSKAKYKNSNLQKSRKTAANHQKDKIPFAKPKNKPPKLEYSTKEEQRLPSVSFSKITAAQLQSKIKSRKDQLKQQIKRKPVSSHQDQAQRLQRQPDKPIDNFHPDKISYNVDA